MTHPPDAPYRRIVLLSLCQALFITATIASVSMAGIVGTRLAPAPWMATVPYGAQFAAIVLFALPVSLLMGRLGRKRMFFFGAGCALAAGGVGYASIVNGSFWGLTASHLLLGLFIAHANYYRFAATDGVDADLRGRAVALVIAGGVIAAAIGPWLSHVARAGAGPDEFATSYLIFSAVGVLTVCVLLFLRIPAAHASKRDAGGADISDAQRSWIVHPIGFVLAIYAGGAGYLIMNLLMVQSTLVLEAFDTGFGWIALAIQCHVLCMFVPSFFTGRLIERFGNGRILATGFIFLAAAGAVGAASSAYGYVFTALLLLGVAWNFLYVGGSAYLTGCYAESHRHRAQGINDTVVSLLAAAGAFGGGALFDTIGWAASNWMVMPFVALGVALLLLSRIGRPTRPSPVNRQAGAGS